MQLVMKKKNFDNTSLERKQRENKYKERHTTNNTKSTEKTVYGCRGLIDNIFFFTPSVCFLRHTLVRGVHKILNQLNFFFSNIRLI